MHTSTHMAFNLFQWHFLSQSQIGTFSDLKIAQLDSNTQEMEQPLPESGGLRQCRHTFHELSSNIHLAED